MRLVLEAVEVALVLTQLPGIQALPLRRGILVNSLLLLLRLRKVAEVAALVDVIRLVEIEVLEDVGVDARRQILRQLLRKVVREVVRHLLRLGPRVVTREVACLRVVIQWAVAHHVLFVELLHVQIGVDVLFVFVEIVFVHVWHLVDAVGVEVGDELGLRAGV